MKTDLSFFEHLKANPDLGAEFGKFMNSQSTVQGGATLDHLTSGLDWAALGRASVVDVSGVLLERSRCHLQLINYCVDASYHRWAETMEVLRARSR